MQLCDRHNGSVFRQSAGVTDLQGTEMYISGTAVAIPCWNVSTAAPDLDQLLGAYRTLDVDVRASARAIRFRYLELARQHHPDKWPAGSPDQATAANRMRQVNAAYSLIEAAPLRHHVFAGEPVDEQPARHPLNRPVSVAVETFIRVGLGAIAGAIVAMSLHNAGVPGVRLYAPALMLVMAFAFTSTSERAADVVRLLWWWC
jgi:hypothetical protein